MSMEERSGIDVELDESSVVEDDGSYCVFKVPLPYPQKPKKVKKKREAKNNKKTKENGNCWVWSTGR
jgi:hypothetical protein